MFGEEMRAQPRLQRDGCGFFQDSGWVLPSEGARQAVSRALLRNNDLC